MLLPGQACPDLELPLTDGSRFMLSAHRPDHFSLLVFYRGLHCPICKKQLEMLASKWIQLTDLGVKPVAISMDSEARAMQSAEAWRTGELPLAFGLSEGDARNWGLYISDKRPTADEPVRFSEPGLFLVRPDRTLYFAQVQSGPFTRPEIDDLLPAIRYVIESGYPPRGAAT